MPLSDAPPVYTYGAIDPEPTDDNRTHDIDMSSMAVTAPYKLLLRAPRANLVFVVLRVASAQLEQLRAWIMAAAAAAEGDSPEGTEAKPRLSRQDCLAALLAVSINASKDGMGPVNKITNVIDVSHFLIFRWIVASSVR